MGKDAMPMTPLRFLALMACAVALGGCAIASPYRSVSDSPALPGETPVVALTHAVLDPATRRGFDQQTEAIYNVLGQQPGIVGYAVRRQFFGNEVWTMTTWRDEASRARFVSSQLHRDGIAAGDKAVRQGRFVRIEVPVGDTPMPWSRALSLLESSAATY
jgi:heme-degrading monooxygenase HmoA